MRKNLFQKFLNDLTFLVISTQITRKVSSHKKVLGTRIVTLNGPVQEPIEVARKTYLWPFSHLILATQNTFQEQCKMRKENQTNKTKQIKNQQHAPPLLIEIYML